MDEIKICLNNDNKYEKIIEIATTKLYNYCLKNNIKMLVTGISGGLDSAVVFKLCEIVSQKCNYKIKNFGIMLPCKTKDNELDYKNSIKLGTMVCLNCNQYPLQFDLTFFYKQFLNNIDLLNKRFGFNPNKIAYGNIIARLRMIILYYIANINNGMVMSTDNLSEYLTGFWTKHGDEGDFGLIQNLWKGSEVIELAKKLNVPKEVINVRPTDGLGINEFGDEGQLGDSYQIIDEILKKFIKNGLNIDNPTQELFINNLKSSKLEKSIAQRVNNTVYKRKKCINLTRKELELD